MCSAMIAPTAGGKICVVFGQRDDNLDATVLRDGASGCTLSTTTLAFDRLQSWGDRIAANQKGIGQALTTRFLDSAAAWRSARAVRDVPGHAILDESDA